MSSKFLQGTCEHQRQISFAVGSSWRQQSRYRVSGLCVISVYPPACPEVRCLKHSTRPVFLDRGRREAQSVQSPRDMRVGMRYRARGNGTGYACARAHTTGVPRRSLFLSANGCIRILSIPGQPKSLFLLERSQSTCHWPNDKKTPWIQPERQ